MPNSNSIKINSSISNKYIQELSDIMSNMPEILMRQVIGYASALADMEWIDEKKGEQHYHEGQAGC